MSTGCCRALDFTCLIIQNEGGSTVNYLKVRCEEKGELLSLGWDNSLIEVHWWDTRVSRSAIRDRGSSSWRELAITSPFYANPWAARFTYIDFRSIIRGKRAKRQKGKRAKRQKGKEANQPDIR